MKNIFGILIPILIAAFFAYTGSEQSLFVGNIPLFASCALISFLIQWLIFIPSYIKQTEHFFDLTGSLTYLSIIGFGLYHSSKEPTQIILGALVAIWALRLGIFLFRRVQQAKGDSRFEQKNQFGWFLMVWTIQGLWVFLTSATAMTVISIKNAAPMNLLSWLGIAIWCFGFMFEVIADYQKTVFKRDVKNKGRFIQSGLWKYSRHPNYFGEIILWLGIALIALPSLHGLSYFSLISPLFVYILLTQISGIPILERQGLDRWGAEEEYQNYLKTTPSLIPFLGQK